MTKHEIVAETGRLFKVYSDLTSTEEQIIIRNKIVQLNLPLVSSYLNKYKPYTADQFQIGCIGLILATNTYDSSKNVPFASWAYFCIERELRMAFKKQKHSIEYNLRDSFVYLDEEKKDASADEYADKYDLFEDPQATEDMLDFIEKNNLHYICDVVIKPAIAGIANTSREYKTAKNIDLWEEYEFKYVMHLVFIDSQKVGLNLTKMAKKTGYSVARMKGKHDLVMQNIFERMWEYMELSFDEIFVRLRGAKTIPSRLLCIDPGKTTGWCLFIDGKLKEGGHIEACYDDKNIDAKKIQELISATNPDFILYEDYKIYGHKLQQHNFSNVMTLRLIGVIESLSQIADIPTHKQMAVTAKNYVTDAKLKLWNFYEFGGKHCRDSIRHGCYFLLFYKKGEDIL